MNERQGSGWILFAGIMILIVGILDIVWGIAAIDDSTFFLEDERYIVSSLNTWGWITLVIGIVKVLAAFSIWRGGAFGAVIGIVVASIGAIGALLTIPAYPFWSVAIFAVDVLIIYGLAAYGARGPRVTT